MAMNRHYTVPFRRKQEQKTNYRRRLGLLKSRKPRLVIRKTLKNMLLQIVTYSPDGDIVQTTARSSDLKKYGLTVVNCNVPIAYLTGLLLAKKAKVKDVVVDFGLQNVRDHSKLYAAVKGAKEGGLNIDVPEDVLPHDDRVAGKHIETYAASLDQEKRDALFSEFKKQKVDITKISSVYEKIKESIQNG